MGLGELLDKQTQNVRAPPPRIPIPLLWWQVQVTLAFEKLDR